MLSFKPLTYDDLSALQPLLCRCRFSLSDYQPITKVMWRSFFHAEYALSNGCLIYKNTIFGRIYFNYPVATREDVDEDMAICEIEKYCLDHYIQLRWWALPQEKTSNICKRYYFLNFSGDRNYDDYLYTAEQFRTYAGKKLSGQRNHLNKFNRLYPNALFRPLKEEDKCRLDEFFERFTYDASEGKKNESALAKAMLKKVKLDDFPTICCELDGKIVSLAFGSMQGKTLIVHIEKGLKEIEGIYAATANAFAKANPDAELISREDDSGTKGLRMSKTQYHPIDMVRKSVVTVENEWQKVKRFPILKTDRLTLTKIEEGDAKEYFDICTDDERNIYWGYDYKKDLKGELTEKYFYNVQKSDLKHKMCFSFAVRLNGKMIGEGVLYRFNGRGEAEAGIRIDRKYAGNGYGKEAFYVMVEWALYGLGLSKVVSKCYHENAASYKMLSERMAKTDSDDTFYYFEMSV